MSAIAGQPRWVGVLVLVACMSALCAAGFGLTAVGRQAMLDQQVQTLESFGRSVTDRQYATLKAVDRYAAPIGLAEGLVGTPLAVLLTSALLFWVFNGLLDGRARFAQVFAVVAHAGVILALQQVLLLPLDYVRQTVSSPVNLSALFPVFDQGTFPARLLGSLDLFRLWWIVLVAIGLGVVYRRRIGRIFLGLTGVYLLIGVILATVQTIAGGV